MIIKFKKIHDDAKLPTRNHGNIDVPTDQMKDELEDQKIKMQFAGQLPPGVSLDFKRDENGDIAGTGDTGYDIYAVEDVVIRAKGSASVPTGIQVAYITPGFWFRVSARSGLSFKNGILCHPGTVDNLYTGDLGILLYNHSVNDYKVHKGDRIAQLIVFPVIEADISWTDEVHETTRGSKGFGSSDVKQPHDLIIT